MKRQRCEKLGSYMVKTNCTVRQAAQKFGISKSTVHEDVTKKLWKVNNVLAEEVSIVLRKNKDERHIRGGAATKLKYELLRKLS